MKVAIVTQYGDNYGNKLQNYALQILLEKEGHSVETIIIEADNKLHKIVTEKELFAKFSPQYIRKVISSRFKNKYKYKNQRDGVLKTAISRNQLAFTKRENHREKAFSDFAEQNLHIHENHYYIGQIDFKDVFDAYICGSDQIWNPTYPSTCSAYFLSFVPQYKRIAFAPSFGISSIPNEQKPLFRKWLSEINYLSVREYQGARIIKELIHRDVPVIADPTMCLAREDWGKIEKNPGVLEKYVLTYFLGNELNKYRKYIEEYARNHKVKIIDLFDLRKQEYYAVDPGEFVWLIHHANAVFTDSFHGVVFSILFHVPFVVFDRIESGGTGMSSRIETLLKTFGMEDRKFSSLRMSLIGINSYDSIDTILTEQRAKALQFLKNALLSVSINVVDKAEKKSVEIKHNAECSGCTACFAACPQNCISMETDKDGFRYPIIDDEKCISCGTCKKVCERAKEKKVTSQSVAFIGYSRDNEVRLSSSSGGIFSELANSIILSGGEVYGAGISRSYEIEHVSVNDVYRLSLLRGSKYVQSDLRNTFKSIKRKLNLGKIVYFSGTPCQVNGLLSFLGHEYENLYTQDIVCHGVSSPAVWKSYCNMENDNKPRDISFRDKTYGWHYFSLKIGNKIKRVDEDIFLRLFLENISIRPSCFVCPHRCRFRKSDVTLADCWGVGGLSKDILDDDKGISLVLVNTEKGRALLSAISSKLVLYKVDFDKAVMSQSAIEGRIPYNQNSEMFFSIAEEEGFEKTINEWYGFDLPVIIKKRVGYYKYKIARMLRYSRK